MPNKFAHQHSHMVEIAESILQVARERADDAASRLTQLRLKLSRQVREHCDTELSLINARRGSTDARQAELIRRYHDDLLRWRHDLIECNSAWPPKRVFADSAGFTQAFSGIAIRLRERVRWEEEEFYPAVLLRAA